MVESATWHATPLGACRQKLIRAREHIETLRRLQHGWLDGVHEPQADYQAEAALWLFSVPELPPPPMQMGAVVSDVLHQIRSALDLLAVVIVSVTNPEADHRKIYFPYCWDAAEWPKTARAKLPGASPAHLALVAQMQPFAGRPELGWLAELSNADKHRYMLPVSCVLSPRSSTPEWGEAVEGEVRIVRRVLSNGDVVGGNTPLLEVVMDPPAAHPPPVHMSLQLGVRFGHFEDGRLGPSLRMMEQMADSAERVVELVAAGLIAELLNGQSPKPKTP